MTREQEIAECKAYIFACEARGNAGLPDLRNREQTAEDVARATLDGLDEHMSWRKLKKHVKKSCGFSLLMWTSLLSFIINVMRLVIEYRRKKAAGEL